MWGCSNEHICNSVVSENAFGELLYYWYRLLLCYCMLLQGHTQMASNAAIDYDCTQQ